MKPLALIVGSPTGNTEARKRLAETGFETFHIPLSAAGRLPAASTKKLTELIHRNALAVILLDARMGKTALHSVINQSSSMPCHLIAIGDQEAQAKFSESVKLGQAIFLSAPINLDYLGELLNDIYEDMQGTALARTDLNEEYSLDQFGELYGSCQAMHDLYRFLRKAAASEAVLCIHGESGTGKELVAKAVHAYSLHRSDDFEAINCAAIPAELVESELFGHEKGSFSGAVSEHIGIFERVGKGTLLLDEITEMPHAMQVKLLRVLESGRFRRVGGEVDRKYGARVIAATNRQPAEAVLKGKLREDLYYRISQLEVEVPPLRARGTDIAELSRLFVAQFNAENDKQLLLSESAEQILSNHHWPGNVRQLWNVIQKACTVARATIEPQDLTLEQAGAATATNTDQAITITTNQTLADAEETIIKCTLARLNGDKARSAQTLGISLRTLYSRLKTYRFAEHT